ncbi:phosphoribosylanthranilate isomerase [Ruminococcus flavefaciens]|uniref:N-(5'-phosphoribosyl)anthranilate isomerase n=1 Tax=Ruminococcus flavefaciens TaxID=1265 RepID=A0A315XVX0_RUMFL|nr:phosphoribosylanthranilate isomerase [Ruminococcus flavefaciens]PWJ11347.1 phosphoribosylanthranilate isomerase [Ruminococcus flavefaciens]SSA50909.1 phosphoribosylanthranilate isomerase [Ruminococcus flavefaciens]
MTKIKMCGLRRPEDIEFANRVKPDYIGYVFAEKSKRYIATAKAAELTKLLDGDIVPVGVFVDETMENVIAAVKMGAVKMVQLHGSESEDFISELKSRGIPVIKAFQVGAAEDIAAAERSCADMVLLDSGKGSGQTFDWSLIGSIKRPYLLAGGITAENAAQAIRQLRPFGVDASSCLETDGFKDIAKMKAFAQAVRAAE